MEDQQPGIKDSAEKAPRAGCLRILGFTAAALLVIILIIAGWVKYNIYASTFTPTELSTQERKTLDSKLALLEESAQRDTRTGKIKHRDSAGALRPEKYTEEGARRDISLTEKELNAMIASTPDVAERVAIDLSDDLLSLKLVVPMDEEIIFLGGKTLRLHVGIILSYKNSEPVIAIKGVSLGGIPLPNAWLGHIKEKNLVEEFGSEGGFWKLFAEGIKNIQVKEGHILISLNE